MEKTEIKNYVLIEKNGNLAITLPEDECNNFDFSSCSVSLNENNLEFEPEMYSSSDSLIVNISSDEHLSVINSYKTITVAQILSKGEFGDIYEIEIE